MIEPQTLITLGGRTAAVGCLSKSTLVLLDAQEVYLSGPLILPGIHEAIEALGRLLERARSLGVPIVHGGSVPIVSSKLWQARASCLTLLLHCILRAAARAD